MMTQGINVDLPDSNSEPLDTTKSEPVIISVTADGSYPLMWVATVKAEISDPGNGKGPCAADSQAQAIYAVSGGR